MRTKKKKLRPRKHYMRRHKNVCGRTILCLAFSHNFVDIWNQNTDETHANIWLSNFKKKVLLKSAAAQTLYWQMKLCAPRQNYVWSHILF